MTLTKKSLRTTALRRKAYIETLGEGTASTTPGEKHYKVPSLEFLQMRLQLQSNINSTNANTLIKANFS